MSEIEPVIGWPAYCDEIMSSLSLAQLEASNLKVEISDLQDEIEDLRSGSYLASVVEERDRLRKALEFYSCNETNCECAQGQERHGDLSCGFVARAALDAKP